MRYEFRGDTAVLSATGGFDAAATLECGQCFRFWKTGEGKYWIVAFGKRLYIEQDGDRIRLYPTDEAEFKEIWLDYFGLDRDYGGIRAALSGLGGPVKAAVDFAPGIRHLRQEVFECLISFIISQNNRIPMIQNSMNRIAAKYGEPIDEGVYAFPSPGRLARADEAGLRECRVGFRARYILDALDKIASGAVNLDRNVDMPTDELREQLKQIKGVGDKVADCVLLFAYGRTEVFPADVWIIRAMTRLFFGGNKTPPDEIRRFAYEKFGENAGIANQYIYHYVRMNPDLSGVV